MDQKRRSIIMANWLLSGLRTNCTYQTDRLYLQVKSRLSVIFVPLIANALQLDIVLGGNRYSRRDREVKARSFLLHIRRRQVDRRLPHRKLKT